MISFINQLASAYYTNERADLRNFCFVFPNKRSGMFFRLQMNKLVGNPGERPSVMTLNGLVARMVDDLKEVTRNEALFTLYQAYTAVVGEAGGDAAEVPTFDRFLYWGSMMLDDFNTVDGHLLDPAMIFVNLKRWKEIESTYLTPEQIDIIRRYWNIETLPKASVDEFWTHTNRETKERNGRFIRLWEVMAPVYRLFTETLAGRKIATRGRMMRVALSRLATELPKELDKKRYVFVGFDFPTVAELALFEAFRNYGIADFYWDFSSPVARADAESGERHIPNPVARMFRSLCKGFPSRYELAGDDSAGQGSVDIVGVPSETGQVKYVGSLLSQWVREKAIRTPDNALETAVVLPDESLFVPLVHAIPPEITAINVTMGFPWKLTPVAALFSKIVSLHLRARTSRNVAGYYYEDVEQIVSHPLVRNLAPDECDRLMQTIRTNRIYTLQADFFNDGGYEVLNVIFTPATIKGSAKESRDYLVSLVGMFDTRLDDDAYKLEKTYFKVFLEQLEELYSTVERLRVEMSETTFLGLLERMNDSQTISFNGSPIKGLQVMGVLETRALDFENVVITSMNERIFPRKSQVRTFIPDAIRRAYGLPTSDIEETRYAYYFYRLISRARRVVLTYDMRTGGLRSGEISRFVAQLLYLYDNGRTVHTSRCFDAIPMRESVIVLPKSEDIMRRLDLFRTAMGEGGRALSASALKDYISCPLKFCLRWVMKIKDEEEIEDYMESSTFGTVVHQVAEEIYRSMARPDAEAHVTPEMLERWTLESNPELDRLITKAVNIHYDHLDEDAELKPLVGETKVMGRMIRQLIVTMLKAEKKLDDLKFVAAELPVVSRWKVNPDLTVNFRQVIDRIDRVAGTLRIVDYKTGSIEFGIGSNVAKMFSLSDDNDLLSVFQVILYCVLYKNHTGDDSPVTPAIYELRTIGKEGLQPITVTVGKKKTPLEDYHDVEAEFVGCLNRMIEEIFDENVPFCQAPGTGACKFCDFKAFCDRVPRND